MKPLRMLFLALPFMMGLLVSCEYNNAEEFFSQSGQPDPCNHPDVISYQDDIIPLIDRSCEGCHDLNDGRGGVFLEGYDNIFVHVQDGSLLGSIEHESAFEAMPRNRAQLPQCDISLVEKWIQNGAPNN